MAARTAGRIARLILLVLAACQIAVPASLAAQDARFAPGSICHTSAKASVSYADLLADHAAWTCEGAEFDWDAERHFIRHDLANRAADAPVPRFAEFDRNEYGLLTVIALEESGKERSISYTFGDTQLGSSSLKSIVPLPRTDTVPVAIVTPRTSAIVTVRLLGAVVPNLTPTAARAPSNEYAVVCAVNAAVALSATKA